MVGLQQYGKVDEEAVPLNLIDDIAVLQMGSRRGPTFTKV